MFDNIIAKLSTDNKQAKNGLAGTIPLAWQQKSSDFDCRASVATELERTPGAVAVKRINSRRMPAGDNPLLVSSKQTQGCGAWAVLSECVSGLHHFAKRIVCGKEWCSDCGQDNSQAHRRRIARVLPKAMQIKSMGYLVVEFPEVYRHIGRAGIEPDQDEAERVKGWCYSKQDLRWTTDKVVEVLAGKRLGRRGRVGGFFKRGLLRWHWYGDKVEGKYNPHINILIDAGFIEPEKLDEIKTALRHALNVPDLIVNYSYCDASAQIYHKVKYITRATFTNYDWSPYMAEELFNFRNQRWFGTWNDEPAWTLDDAEAGEDAGLLATNSLHEGRCPDCGQPLKTLYHNHEGHAVQWTQPVDSVYLKLWDAQEIAGTGFYRIPHKEWSGTDYSPDKVVQLTRGDAFVALLAGATAMRKQGHDDDNEEWWRGILAS